MTELVVNNVQKWLGGLQILKGASFTAERGSIVALLGASGSGKTTLLRCVAGLEQPEIGRIVIGDKTVLDGERKIALPPEQRNIGLVFQSYALWPHRTVRENVGYGLKLRGVAPAEIGRRVQAILERLGLGHLADRYPIQLSGGQQQRVAICRALVYEPRVLLLDEPLSNLDAKLREEARYWIRKLILDLEICAILVTHDQSEALAAADNILLLQDGASCRRARPRRSIQIPTASTPRTSSAPTTSSRAACRPSMAPRRRSAAKVGHCQASSVMRQASAEIVMRQPSSGSSRFQFRTRPWKGASRWISMIPSISAIVGNTGCTAAG